MLSLALEEAKVVSHGILRLVLMVGHLVVGQVTVLELLSGHGPKIDLRALDEVLSEAGRRLSQRSFAAGSSKGARVVVDWPLHHILNEG